MHILQELKSRFAAHLASYCGDPAAMLEMIRPSQDQKFGDYQANLAMPLGKQLARSPRDVAVEIVSRLDVADICQPPEIAGPGFINLRLRNDWLANQIQQAALDERLGIGRVRKPRTFIVDYSAPNVAKPMHVGHIRSTVIGDAIYRTLKFLGHRVVGDNHLGDWGTQFGMILYGYKHFLDRAAYQRDPVAELARLYRLVRELVDAQSAEVGAAVLEETARLHAGDPDSVRLWREFLPACMADISRIYERLGVKFDEVLGESFYHDRLAAVVNDLEQKQLAVESDGAICVFLEGHDTPMIVRKKDGAYLYATTDLATIQYRMERWKPDAILYVVDHRQSLHFEQLFSVARRWGYQDVELKHVSFGTVLGEDGRPFKTRAGDTVGLEGLLDDAVSRALAIVTQNDDAKPAGPELSGEERRRVAEAVGIGAIKYADLSQNRTSDYTFSYDKMLAMQGNTAAYMQYAHARIRSIFAKGKKQLGEALDLADSANVQIALEEPAERALAIEVLRFAEALDNVVADYRPNLLTNYLFDLSNRFSTFYERCPVIKAETPDLQRSRLALCDVTARVIKQGLDLLGIEAVERM